MGVELRCFVGHQPPVTYKVDDKASYDRAGAKQVHLM